jgi:MFS family permease
MTTSPPTLSPAAHAAVPRSLTGPVLCVLLSSFGASSANVALPALQRAFGASFAAVQWIVLAYLLAAAAAVGAGRLGDMIGRRRVLLGGIALFAAASGACALAHGLPVLVAARAVQGLGAAVMLALGMALAAGGPVRRGTAGGTGRAMGLLGSMSAVGTALGPALGGLLLAGPGWRAVFAAMLPGTLLAFVLVRRLPRDAPPRGAAPFDVAGLLLVLRDPVLASGFAMTALAMALMMATMLVGPFYLGLALGLPAGAVGAALAVGPVVAALAGVPAGHIVDRHGARGAGVTGLTVMTLSACLLAQLPVRAGVVGWIAPVAVLTAGYALFQAANNTAVMEAAGDARRGVVAGLSNLARQLGLIAGSSLPGAVFAPDMGRDVVTATHATFAVAALLPLLALGVALLGRPARRRSP